MQKWTNEVRSERRHWINVTPLKDKKVLANNNIFIDFSNWKMSWCLHWQPPPLCHPPSAICIAIWSKTFSAICHYKPSRSTGKWRWDLFLLCRSKGFIYFMSEFLRIYARTWSLVSSLVLKTKNIKPYFYSKS